ARSKTDTNSLPNHAHEEGPTFHSWETRLAALVVAVFSRCATTWSIRDAALEAAATMRLPLLLQTPLLRRDAFGRAEQRVAAEILVTLLHETEPLFVPDDPVVHQFGQAAVGVAFELW